jgi:hypothetical protein
LPADSPLIFTEVPETKDLYRTLFDPALPTDIKYLVAEVIGVHEYVADLAVVSTTDMFSEVLTVDTALVIDSDLGSPIDASGVMPVRVISPAATNFLNGIIDSMVVK